MAAIDKVKIIVVGDSVNKNREHILLHNAKRKMHKKVSQSESSKRRVEMKIKDSDWIISLCIMCYALWRSVGKTSLTHLICQQQPIGNPSWTIGCSVEVKLHEYKEGTPNQRRYFVELWDVGGSQSHKNTRSVFYNPTNGIILVHDLTNRKSQQNLQKWLEEVLSKDGTSSRSKSFEDFDPEKFVGSTQIPILVIGTKLDLISESNFVKSNIHRRSATIAEECGADEIFLDCRQIRSLAAGSSSSVKLSRFFDKVIERRYYSSREALSPDKRRPPLYTSSLYPKYYHND